MASSKKIPAAPDILVAEAPAPVVVPTMMPPKPVVRRVRARPASQDAPAALPAASAVEAEKPRNQPAQAETSAKVENPVKAEKDVKAEKEPKAAKPKKAKLVRDSFTMPEAEYAGIAELKKRLLGQGLVSKKSEVLRAGVALLASLSDAELRAAMQKVEIIKTGRPAASPQQ